MRFVLFDFLRKAVKKKDYGRLIPEKIIRSDGRQETYWVSPEDRNQGDLKGQMDLFSQEDAGGAKGNDRGYFDDLDRGAENYQIKPLIDHVAQSDPHLAKRLEHKYANYRFDRETKESDIELDYEVAWYLTKMKNRPHERAELEAEFHEKNDSATRSINKRKATMLHWKKGSRVKAWGAQTTIIGFSPRGYPIVDMGGGKKRTAMFEELEA